MHTPGYPIRLFRWIIFLLFAFAHHAYAAETLVWAGCGITKKAFMAELAAGFEKKTGIKIQLQGGGATKGIRGVADKKMDMGGSCRIPLPMVDSREDRVKVHPVAWDALAVIVHKGNPVDDLTADQIKGIWLGRITNWKQVGGKDAPIHLYVRKGKISGVGYATRQYLFGDHNIDFVTAKSRYTKSSGPLEKAIEKDPLGIGITGVSSARKRDVKIIGFDGMHPTYENVRDGKYTMYRPLYLVTGTSPGPKVRAFIKYAKSAEGARILRENGTVPYRDALHLMSNMRIYGLGN